MLLLQKGNINILILSWRLQLCESLVCQKAAAEALLKKSPYEGLVYLPFLYPQVETVLAWPFFSARAGAKVAVYTSALEN